MRILLADDTAKVRFALRVLLERKPGLRVIGEAENVEEMLAMAKAVCPELVLLDWELPEMDPTLTLMNLRLYCPQVQVIALSSRPERRQIALASGADAFISKAIPPDSLLNVIIAYQEARSSVERRAP